MVILTNRRALIAMVVGLVILGGCGLWLVTRDAGQRAARESATSTTSTTRAASPAASTEGPTTGDTTSDSIPVIGSRSTPTAPTSTALEAEDSTDGDVGPGDGAPTTEPPRPESPTTTIPGSPPTTTPPPERTPAATLHPGGRVRVLGSDFKANSNVRLELHSDPVVLDEVTADASGDVDEVVQIPGDAPPGEHDVVIIGVDPNDQPRTITIPIDLIVQTAGRVTRLSGTIVNANGDAVDRVVINAYRIDGSASSQGESDANGNFSFDVPTGIIRVKFWWGGWVDPNSYDHAHLHLPREWSVEIPTVDFSAPTTWNIQLPPTIPIEVRLPVGEEGGIIVRSAYTDRWGYENDPISSTIAISETVTGVVRMGDTQGQSWNGSPAIIDVFPVDSVVRIFEVLRFGGDSGIGLNDVDLSVPRSLTLVTSNPPVRVWFLLTDSNSEITSISAINRTNATQSSSNGPTIWLEVGQSYDITVVGLTDGTEWQDSFSNRGFADNWNETVIVPSHRPSLNLQASVTVAPGVHFDSSTLAITTTIAFSDDAYLPVEMGLTAIENLLPGFSCPRGIPLRCVATTNGTSSSVSFPDLVDKIDSVTVLAQAMSTSGVLLKDSAFIAWNDIPATIAHPIDLELNNPGYTPTGGTIAGQVVNSLGGVGRTRILYRLASGAVSPLNGFESDADGVFSIPVPINPSQVVIQGEGNIDPSRGVPRLWSLVVPTNVFDLGVFTLPEPEIISIQVLSPLGFPIPGVRIGEIPSLSSHQTLVSSTGINGLLFNGNCPDYLQYECLGSTDPNSETTDSYGIARLRRFAGTTMGKLHLIIPASGPNAASELTVDPTTLSGGVATVVVPGRL